MAVAVMPPTSWQPGAFPGSPLATMQQFPPGSTASSLQISGASPYLMQGTPPTPPLMTAAPPWASTSASLNMMQVPLSPPGSELPPEIIPGGAILPRNEAANAPSMPHVESTSGYPGMPSGSGELLPPGSFSFSETSLGSSMGLPYYNQAPASKFGGGMYPPGMQTFPAAMSSRGSFPPSRQSAPSLDLSRSQPHGSMETRQRDHGQSLWLEQDTFDPLSPSFDPRQSPHLGSLSPGSVSSLPQDRTASKEIPLSPPRQFPLKPEDRQIKFPIVHNPHPVTPCPMTEVYGYTMYDISTRDEEKIRGFSEVRPYCGWGQASLRHAADLTFTDRIYRAVIDLKWYFIESNGALLNFWDRDFADELYTHGDHGGLHPVQYLDMRNAQTVHTEVDHTVGVQCHHKVVTCFTDGKFTFKVRSREESEAWKGRIFRVIAETAKLVAVVQELGHEVVAERARMGMRGVTMQKFMKKLHSTPAERETLKGLIDECIREYSRGITPRREIFQKMFHLYARGADMDLHKIELLFKDMLEIRRDALRRAIHEQEKILFSTHRSVFAGDKSTIRKAIENAQDLVAYFNGVLQPERFMDEVVAFRSTCDVTKDGIVNIKEFIKAGPPFMLPNGQLSIEAAILHPQSVRAHRPH
mmetsp:Transcript_13497/g.22212  ORF Transcript_13497/g.22212 Transcript_13497/m.22212 type:complete len:640 (+) Transcript_13497:169-2088(+)